MLNKIIGAVTGSNQAGAIGDAAAMRQQGIEDAIGTLTDQFGVTSEAFDPFIQTGTSAFDLQAALSGALGPEAQANAYNQAQASPAQQFLRDRAETALKRNAAVTGQLGGGRTALGLQEQAMGFAMQDVDNMYNRLGGIAGTGLGFLGDRERQRQSLATNTANLQSGSADIGAQALIDASQARDAGYGNIIGLGASAMGFGNPLSVLGIDSGSGS